MKEDDTPAGPGRAGFDALWERVDNQGRALRGLAEETASQFRDFRADMAKTTTELAAAIKGVDTKIDTAARSAAEHSRPQYATLIGGMIAAAGLAVGVIQWQNALRDKPVDDKIAAMTLAIQDLAHNTSSGFAESAKNTISRNEYATAVDFRNKITDLTDKYNTQIRDRMQAQVDKIEASEVGRAEHEVHWASVAKRDSEIQGEILALNTRLDQLAPAGDVIKRLSEVQHELELKVYGGAR